METQEFFTSSFDESPVALPPKGLEGPIAPIKEYKIPKNPHRNERDTDS